MSRPANLITVDFWNHRQHHEPLTAATCEIVTPVIKPGEFEPGTYLVRDGDGCEFTIQVCSKRFEIGERVPFYHRGRTRAGKPRHPRFNQHEDDL